MYYCIHQTSCEKEIKCSASLAFYIFSPTRLINSIKHEHSCKNEMTLADRELMCYFSNYLKAKFISSHIIRHISICSICQQQGLKLDCVSKNSEHHSSYYCYSRGVARALAKHTFFLMSSKSLKLRRYSVSLRLHVIFIPWVVRMYVEIIHEL